MSVISFVKEDCAYCQELVDLSTAVENRDPWGVGTGELFCNADCYQNAGEAYDERRNSEP